MKQHILRVAVAIFQPTEQLDDLRVNAVNTDVKNGFLAGLSNRFVQLLFRFAHHLFDPSGMNATVGYELLQGQTRDFPANRIMSRNHHRLRRIVDDKIDSSGRLQSADVAPFSADDLSLEFIVGQRQHRH